MRLELSAEQQRRLTEFRDFAEREVQPLAAMHDRHRRVGPEIIAMIASRGYLAPTLPVECGGCNLDLPSYVLLHEQIGRACASLRSLLTVHDMAAYIVFRFGDEGQRRRWLPDLTAGRRLAAFALTEREAGSEISSITTAATKVEGGWRLDGEKAWISFGELAQVFVVFARTGTTISTFLVERGMEGFTTEAVDEVIGLRGSMPSELRFRGCFVSEANLIGRLGRGHPQMTTAALTLGRLGVAAGCVGLLQACADASFQYTRSRRRAGVPLAHHQLIAAKLADIYVALDAARLLCMQAAILLQENDPRALVEVAIAKQFAATAAMRAAHHTVQIHGANGCSNRYPAERYYRDAKIMEIIEGTNELQQLIIGQHGYADLPSFVRPSVPCLEGNSYDLDRDAPRRSSSHVA
jgi:glutaryl-CoA dehydrogenase (non-decarboxylating)